MSNDKMDEIITSVKQQHPSAGEKVIQGHLQSRNIRTQQYKLREILKWIDMDEIPAPSSLQLKGTKFLCRRPITCGI